MWYTEIDEKMLCDLADHLETEYLCNADGKKFNSRGFLRTYYYYYDFKQIYKMFTSP